MTDSQDDETTVPGTGVRAAVEAQQRSAKLDRRVDNVEERVGRVERRVDSHGTELARLGTGQATITTSLARRDGTPAAAAHRTAVEAHALAKEAERALRQAESEARAREAELVAAVTLRLEEQAERHELALAKIAADVRDLTALVQRGQQKQSAVRLEREAHEGLAIAEARERTAEVARAAQDAGAAAAQVRALVEQLADARQREVHARSRELWLIRILLLLVVVVAVLKGIDPKSLPIPQP